jgi:hypothetical protein
MFCQADAHCEGMDEVPANSGPMFVKAGSGKNRGGFHRCVFKIAALSPG